MLWSIDRFNRPSTVTRQHQKLLRNNNLKVNIELVHLREFVIIFVGCACKEYVSASE